MAVIRGQSPGGYDYWTATSSSLDVSPAACEETAAVATSVAQAAARGRCHHRLSHRGRDVVLSGESRRSTIADVLDDAPVRRLQSAPLAWLTTVRRDGQPQTSYIWFHHDGHDIVLLSQPNTPKIRNIEGNPKVSLNLDGDTSTGGGVLTLEATAEIIGAIPPDRWRAYVAKYESRIKKGPWGTPSEFIASYSVAVRISPTRVRAW